MGKLNPLASSFHPNPHQTDDRLTEQKAILSGYRTSPNVWKFYYTVSTKRCDKDYSSLLIHETCNVSFPPLPCTIPSLILQPNSSLAFLQSLNLKNNGETGESGLWKIHVRGNVQDVTLTFCKLCRYLAYVHRFTKYILGVSLERVLHDNIIRLWLHNCSRADEPQLSQRTSVSDAKSCSGSSNLLFEILRDVANSVNLTGHAEYFTESCRDDDNEIPVIEEQLLHCV